jgi:hypothetical protein
MHPLQPTRVRMWQLESALAGASPVALTMAVGRLVTPLGAFGSIVRPVLPADRDAWDRHAGEITAVIRNCQDTCRKRLTMTTKHGPDLQLLWVADLLDVVAGTIRLAGLDDLYGPAPADRPPAPRGGTHDPPPCPPDWV